MTTSIFKSIGAIIIYVLLFVGVVCLIGYKYWGWFQKSVNSNKAIKPSLSDCGENTNSKVELHSGSTNIIIGTSAESQCTKPLYDSSQYEDELCFTKEILGLNNGDIVPSEYLIDHSGENSKKYHFNRQSGKIFCYVFLKYKKTIDDYIGTTINTGNVANVVVRYISDGGIFKTYDKNSNIGRLGGSLTGIEGYHTLFDVQGNTNVNGLTISDEYLKLILKIK